MTLEKLLESIRREFFHETVLTKRLSSSNAINIECLAMLANTLLARIEIMELEISMLKSTKDNGAS